MALSCPSALRAEWLCPDTCSTTDLVLEQTWTVDPSTGSVGGLGGAVSEMFTLELDGVPFAVSGLPAVDLATDNLIVGPHAHGALSVRRHYRLMPGAPELRVATELLNTSGIPQAVSLVLRGAHASGPDVQVALTASGDARVDAWDHWLHLDDGLEDDEGVLDLLIASDGVGVCPVGAMDVDLHPDGTLEWYYALTVPGGSQVKLVHLLGLAADDEDALLGLSGFTSTPAPVWAAGLPGPGPVLNWLVDDDDGDRVVDVLSLGADCDDTRADVYPGAEEVCDLVDNDCDGLTDEGVATLYYRDQDGDGYGTSLSVAALCADVVGWSQRDGDCNDADAGVRPGAVEVCDDVDNNCNGFIDEGVEQDLDADGQPGEDCGGLDCDDANPGVYFGATEACDGIDNDCNGVADDVDRDEDGWVDVQCGGEDCNDLAQQIHPGSRELCNGWDDDCDGLLDDLDLDGDGAISDRCTGGRDCDDGDPARGPASPEDCRDLIDNDCDGLVDAADEEDCSGAGCRVASRGGSDSAPLPPIFVALFLLFRLRKPPRSPHFGARSRLGPGLSVTLSTRACPTRWPARHAPTHGAERPPG